MHSARPTYERVEIATQNIRVRQHTTKNEDTTNRTSNITNADLATPYICIGIGDATPLGVGPNTAPAAPAASAAASASSAILIATTRI